jgi:hypothetical protein
MRPVGSSRLGETGRILGRRSSTENVTGIAMLDKHTHTLIAQRLNQAEKA